MKSTKVIGICGRSGAGKSFVCSVFASFGGVHIDTDAIYHKLLEPKDGKLSECAAALISEFGDTIAKGLTVDRSSLGKIVFSDREKLQRLNEISHAYIKRETVRKIMRCRSRFALIDAPLLFESGFDKLCDFTVCVSADDETCIRRQTERDGISMERARARLSNQLSAAKLEALCDFTVDNSLGRDVEPDVKKILILKGLL